MSKKSAKTAASKITPSSARKCPRDHEPMDLIRVMDRTGRKGRFWWDCPCCHFRATVTELRRRA